MKDGVNDNNQPLTLQPQNGMLAIWDAMLHHEVPPTKGRRMCISMNIDKGSHPDKQRDMDLNVERNKSTESIWKTS